MLTLFTNCSDFHSDPWRWSLSCLKVHGQNKNIIRVYWKQVGISALKYWRESALAGQLGNMAKYENLTNCQPKWNEYGKKMKIGKRWKFTKSEIYS